MRVRGNGGPDGIQGPPPFKSLLNCAVRLPFQADVREPAQQRERPSRGRAWAWLPGLHAGCRLPLSTE